MQTRAYTLFIHKFAILLMICLNFFLVHEETITAEIIQESMQHSVNINATTCNCSKTEKQKPDPPQKLQQKVTNSKHKNWTESDFFDTHKYLADFTDYIRDNDPNKVLILDWYLHHRIDERVIIDRPTEKFMAKDLFFERFLTH